MAILIAQPQRGLFKARLGRVRTWAAARLGTTSHEQRVMQIAVGLFKLTARQHGLNALHRRLLMLAALLHDVGRVDGPKKHHVNGARMIRKNPTLELRPSERLAVAYLARYHRGRMPDSHKKWRFDKLVDPTAMHLLLAILRVADTLDSRNIATPALAMRLKSGTIRISCYVQDLREAEKTFNRPKKFRPLEELLGMRLTLQLQEAQTRSAA